VRTIAARPWASGSGGAEADEQDGDGAEDSAHHRAAAHEPKAKALIDEPLERPHVQHR
jgi:hypothetical protein